MIASSIEEALTIAVASPGSAGARSGAAGGAESIEQSSAAIKIILPKRMRDAGTSLASPPPQREQR